MVDRPPSLAAAVFYVGLVGHTDSVFDLQLVRRGVVPEALKRRKLVMLISRRHFVVGSASAGLFSVLPTLAERVALHIEQYEEPLLEAPSIVEETMFTFQNDEGDWELEIGDWDAAGEIIFNPPTLTWREYILGRLEKYGSVDVALGHHGIEEEDLDSIVDKWYLQDTLMLEWAPSWRAINRLQSLGLGGHGAQAEEFIEDGTSLGALGFWMRGAPGSDHGAAEVTTDAALSCLQDRLNNLNSGISIEYGSGPPC